MTLNFKLHVNKCVLNHYVFQLFIRKQRKSRNVFKDNVSDALVIICLILVQILGCPYLNYVSV